MSFAPENEPLADPKALLNVPVGLVSPLWPLFAGVAVSGAAWWWMTRWAQPKNLEAMFATVVETVETAPEPRTFAEPALAVAEAAIEAAVGVEPVIEAAEDVVTETATEAVAAVPAPVLHALAETDEVLAPVGVEAAPIAPALAAMTPDTAVEEARPKARKRLVGSQPDDAPAAD